MSGPSPNGTNMRFVLATANPHKAAEIREIVRGAVGDGIELVERPTSVPEVEETGETLAENAMLKAVALSEATGLPAMADDTGLEVEALKGAPGVYSARYSGEGATYESNVRKLLAELGRAGASEPEQRRARFKTVATAYFPDGRSFVAEGVVDGRIAPEATGKAGFGYDPVFVPLDGDGRTFAEMSSAEKHSVSHRGRAFRALAIGLTSA